MIKRALAIAMLVLVNTVLAAPVAAGAEKTQRPSHYQNSVYWARLDAQRAINYAAWRWGVSAAWLTRVAWCESSMLPWVVNPYSGTVGLFQYQWATWYAWAPRIREYRSPFNAWAAANVAAWAFARGYSGAWVCR